jgi:hypothetical protein
MSLLATLEREGAATRMGRSGTQGLPGLMLDAERRFGPGAPA